MKDRLNVCVMAPNLNAYSETFIRNQIQRLPENVFDIYGAWLPYVQSNGQPVLDEGLFSRAFRKACREFLRFSEQDLLARGVIQYLIKNKIDVVLAQYGLMGAGVMDCCSRAGIPLVVHFHGFDVYAYHVWDQFGDAYTNMFRSANRIIAVSEHMKEYLSGRGCPPDKIEVNPCGVDTDFFSPAEEVVSSPRFVSVARLVPVKGPLATLKAFHLVWQELNDAKLTFVGDGDLEEECKQLSKSLGIQDAVTFAGVLTMDDVLKTLRQSKVFVQHSMRVAEVVSEGSPVSVLEAAATGLPVVATQHGGIKESVTHGETGFLVEEGDIESMARYMKKLALDDDLRRQMGQKARQRMIDLYDFKKTIGRLDQILRDATK